VHFLNVHPEFFLQRVRVIVQSPVIFHAASPVSNFVGFVYSQKGVLRAQLTREIFNFHRFLGEPFDIQGG
jgi:hypothetical protein